MRNPQLGKPGRWLPILGLVIAKCGLCSDLIRDSGSTRPNSVDKSISSPVIDSDLTNIIWAAAPKAEIFYDRQSGSQGIDQTVARILYDDKYIYVSFYCHESLPDKIVGRETIRDSKYA